MKGILSTNRAAGANEAIVRGVVAATLSSTLRPYIFCELRGQFREDTTVPNRDNSSLIE